MSLYIVEILKTQQATIGALQARVKALEAKVATLEGSGPHRAITPCAEQCRVNLIFLVSNSLLIPPVPREFCVLDGCPGIIDLMKSNSKLNFIRI